MNIIEKKDNYQTLADKNKIEAVVNALNAGVCALGIIGIEALKRKGIDFNDGFLQTVNYFGEPVIGLAGAGSVVGMVKNIAKNIHYEKLIASADKIININETYSRGGR